MSTKKTIDDALINFIEATDDKTIISHLSETNDMKAFDLKAQKLEKKINFLMKAQEQQSKSEILIEVVKRFEDALLKGTEKPVAMLKHLIGANHSFALNKSFENLTKEEIIEIIKDKNLIELLDKLNEE